MNRASLQLFGRIVLITILVVLAVWLLRRFLPALAWAAVLAIATWPVREWLTDKGVKTSNAASSLTFVVGVLIVGPLVVLAVQMAREGVVIVQGVRELRENGLGTPEWVAQIPFVGGYVASWWTAHLADPDAAKELLGRAESMAVTQWGRSFGSELVSRLVILVFTLLTLFFAYRDGPTIIRAPRTMFDFDA
jgi:predicted PurR-regulated permease PerM